MIHYNKSIELLNEYYRFILDKTQKNRNETQSNEKPTKLSTILEEAKGIKTDFNCRLCLHLLTGEFMVWFPVKSYSSSEPTPFALKFLDIKIPDVITDNDEWNHGLGIQLIENLFYQIQADLERDELLADIDLGLDNDMKTGDALMTVNILLHKVDAFFMSYEDINELIEILERINFKLDKMRRKGTRQISALRYKVIVLTMEKVNFLFRKALLGKHLSIPDSEQEIIDLYKEEKYLSKIPGFERFYMNFMYPHFKSCVDFFGGQNPELPKTIVTRINKMEELDNLYDYYRAIRYYRKIIHDKNLKSNDVFKKENLKRLEQIEKIFNEDNKYKSAREASLENYDRRAVDSLKICIERAKWEIRIELDEEINMEAFKRNLSQYEEQIKKNKTEDIFFSPARTFARYCEKIIKIPEKYEDLLSVWNAWNKAIVEWKRKIKQAFHHNFHPFFSTVEEAKFKLKFEGIPSNIKFPYLVVAEEDLKIDGTIPSLFIASGYLSPLNRQKLYQSVNTNQIENVKSLDDWLTKAKESIRKESIKAAKEPAKKAAEKAIKKELKQAENQTMTVLGIFASVITFASTAVVVPKYVNSIGSAILFLGTIGFGLTVFVFVLLFHYSRSNDTEVKSVGKPEPLKEILLRYWKHVLLGFFVMIVYSTMIIFGYILEKESKQSRDAEEKRLQDSINQNKIPAINNINYNNPTNTNSPTNTTRPGKPIINQTVIDMKNIDSVR